MADTKPHPVLEPTGLTDEECQELHSYFTRGTLVWIAASAVAHFLVFNWMPWFPG